MAVTKQYRYSCVLIGPLVDWLQFIRVCFECMGGCLARQLQFPVDAPRKQRNVRDGLVCDGTSASGLLEALLLSLGPFWSIFLIVVSPNHLFIHFISFCYSSFNWILAQYNGFVIIFKYLAT